MSNVLTEYDFIVVLDRSGSMSETDCPRGLSRWDYMKESIMAFSRDVAALDSDGIGLVVFGGATADSYDNVGPDKVKDVLERTSPRGSTPLTEALNEAFALAGKSDKKDFIMVFTDGGPDERHSAAQAIIDHANKQETDDACTVLFVQVGRDKGATAYLKSLDDDLKGAKFDIVDAMTIEEAEKFPTIVALVEKAISD